MLSLMKRGRRNTTREIRDKMMTINKHEWREGSSPKPSANEVGGGVSIKYVFFFSLLHY